MEDEIQDILLDFRGVKHSGGDGSGGKGNGEDQGNLGDNG